MSNQGPNHHACLVLLAQVQGQIAGRAKCKAERRGDTSNDGEWGSIVCFRRPSVRLEPRIKANANSLSLSYTLNSLPDAHLGRDLRLEENVYSQHAIFQGRSQHAIQPSCFHHRWISTPLFWSTLFLQARLPSQHRTPDPTLKTTYLSSGDEPYGHPTL